MTACVNSQGPTLRHSTAWQLARLRRLGVGRWSACCRSGCAAARITLPTDPGAPFPDFAQVHAQAHARLPRRAHADRRAGAGGARRRAAAARPRRRRLRAARVDAARGRGAVRSAGVHPGGARRHGDAAAAARRARAAGRARRRDPGRAHRRGAGAGRSAGDPHRLRDRRRRSRRRPPACERVGVDRPRGRRDAVSAAAEQRAGSCARRVATAGRSTIRRGRDVSRRRCACAPIGPAPTSI